MGGSPSVEAAPGQGSNWILPALIGVVLGPTLAATLAWQHVSPKTAPITLVLLMLCLLLAVAEFTLASSFAALLDQRPSWWRPVVLLAVLALGILCAVAVPHPIRWVTAGAAALLLAWNARLAEVLGSQLGVLLRDRGTAASQDWSRMAPECTGVVLESWIVTGGAVYFAAAHDWLMVSAVLVTALCGVAIMAGAKMGSLHLASARDGFSWEERDSHAMWTYVTVLGLGAAALGVLLTAALPPLASGRFFQLVGQGFTDLFPNPHSFHGSKAIGVHPVTPSYATPVKVGGPTTGGRTPAPSRPSVFNGMISETLRHIIILVGAYLPAAIPFILVVVLPLAVLVLIVRYFYETWGGGLNAALDRLWQQIASLIGLRRLLGRRPAQHREERTRAIPTHGSRPTPVSALHHAWQALVDPRRAIRATYRQFLAQAAEEGHAIALGQTPAQFEESLSPLLSDERPAAQELTRAYEEARYSDHSLNIGLVPRLRAAVARAISILHRGARPAPERRWHLGRHR